MSLCVNDTNKQTHNTNMPENGKFHRRPTDRVEDNLATEGRRFPRVSAGPLVVCQSRHHSLPFDVSAAYGSVVLCKNNYFCCVYVYFFCPGERWICNAKRVEYQIWQCDDLKVKCCTVDLKCSLRALVNGSQTNSAVQTIFV